VLQTFLCSFIVQPAFMRKTLLLTAIFCCVIINCTDAQYADIPDANFRSFLQQHYPGCFNSSGQMDTTCAGILSANTLTLPPLGNTIATLEGIQYFKSLQTLDCSFANVVNIPSLPVTLKSFICQNNGLTTWPALPPALEIFNCSECGMTSLPALPASLRTLDCSNNTALTALPALPPSLTTLTCHSCQLTSLPALPAFLVTLNCSDNPALEQLPALPSSLQFMYIASCHILTIPDPLPVALKELNCSSNGSISTIPSLPNSLEKLDCRSNQVTTLPGLPSALVYLECGRNRIEALPALPASLTELYCYLNQLTTLPVLPAGLKILFCGANLFGNNLSSVVLPDGLQSFYCEGGNYTALPSRLPPSLVNFHCGANRLTSLPPLPSTLKNLNCFANYLTSLPDLPTNLERLECENNNIYCLPKLPQSTSTDPFFLGLQITFDADKIKCIPNRPALLNLEGDYPNGGSIYNLPLCNPSNNAHQCQAFPVISGTVFYDSNMNGIKDNGEALKPNMAVQLSNGSRTYTDLNGYFEIAVDSLISYTVTAAPPFYFNMVPASNTYHFTNYDTLVSANYALQANTAIDSLSIRITPLNWAARPGFNFLYLVSTENLGTTTLSPSIHFLFDDTKLIYDSSSNAAVTHIGNNLSLAAGSLPPGNSKGFVGYFRLLPNVSLNETLSSNATVTAGTYVNSTKTTVPVRGSFDPNDKQATPQLSPAQVANGDYIDYTIRFQNTGTDTAFNVVISDTLSSLLQANTLQMIAASHNCKTTAKNNIVFFEFLNIQLPDSNVNEAKSHGFVSFKIKPKNNVSVNSTINNKAAIYFDYNAPVITNTASTLIKEFITVPLKLVSFSAVPQTDRTTTLYWNTANEINSSYFVIESGTDGLRFNSITTITAKGMANNSYTSTVADNNTGIAFYRLKMVDKDGRFTYSPIIKIDRRKNTPGFTILSNPVKDMLIISSNDAALHNSTALIINSTGTVVKSFVLKDGTQTIDIHLLPPGVYYIRSNSGSQKLLIR